MRHHTWAEGRRRLRGHKPSRTLDPACVPAWSSGGWTAGCKSHTWLQTPRQRESKTRRYQRWPACGSRSARHEKRGKWTLSHWQGFAPRCTLFCWRDNMSERWISVTNLREQNTKYQTDESIFREQFISLLKFCKAKSNANRLILMTILYCPRTRRCCILAFSLSLFLIQSLIGLFLH